MTVQLAAVSIDDESLGITTQHFALHQFTPLESAALKIIAKIGRDVAIGGVCVKVAHGREAINAPGISEKLHFGQLPPLEEVVFAVRELVHGLVRDLAEGAQPRVMAAAIILSNLALGVKRRQVGCRRVVPGSLITSVHLFRGNNLLVVSVNVNDRVVVRL
jgi:hypothetical protein